LNGNNRKKHYTLNFLLLFTSIFLSILVVEGITRIVFDPIDYLKPRTIDDNILGLRIRPNTGAHDSWGFRNKYVPITTDIVAIGDSHTYGITATSYNSWPYVIKRLTGKNTYNLSLGGYGPVEYFYLLQNKALTLKPSLIITGLYFGNDILNAYISVYENSYWSNLRNPKFIPDQIVSQSKPDRDDFFYKLKEWLPGNSVLYRIISSSFIGDELRNMREIYRGEEVIMFEDKEHNINTGFTPTSKLRAMNLKLPEVREGLRISLELINRMSEICRQENIEYLVVLIPTKESVYSEFISNNSKIPNSQTIDELISNEIELNTTVKDYLERNNIDYVDVLDPLRAAAGKQQLYPNNFGSHSNKNGYRIIANTINQYLLNNPD